MRKTSSAGDEETNEKKESGRPAVSEERKKEAE